MSRASHTASLLSALWLISVSAHSAELLTSIESDVIIPPELQEHLDSSLVIRHRFVEVDVELLWELFESARELDNLDAANSIQFGFFGDFSVELRFVKISHRYWSSNAMLVTTLPGYGTDPNANIFANMTLKRDESVSARIWAAGEIYYIAPVADGPVHVITQVDPEKMPALD